MDHIVNEFDCGINFDGNGKIFITDVCVYYSSDQKAIYYKTYKDYISIYGFEVELAEECMENCNFFSSNVNIFFKVVK